MTNFEVTIVSDTVCPWCYIGYCRLKTAISRHLTQNPGDSFAIRWQPFQLSPHSPRNESVDKKASYEAKYGTQGTEAIFDRLRSAGKDTGIAFCFGGRTGNTLDSHRLIEFAQLNESATEVESGPSNRGSKLVEELFADYFERERDITSHDILAKAAARAGLDEQEVITFLSSDSLAQETLNKANDSRNDGVSGVPYFIIKGDFTVEGAQEPAAFLMLFNRLKKRERATL